MFLHLCVILCAGGSLSGRPPWTETPLDRDAPDRDPQTEIPLDRDTLYRAPLDRDPQRPLERDSWTETPKRPLDRDPPAQRPPCTETPRMVRSRQYASYWNAFLFKKFIHPFTFYKYFRVNYFVIDTFAVTDPGFPIFKRKKLLN